MQIPTDFRRQKQSISISSLKITVIYFTINVFEYNIYYSETSINTDKRELVFKMVLCFLFMGFS